MEKIPERAICFTGHRPAQLGGYAANNPIKLWVEEQLEIAIKRAVDKGTTWFISGGALGVDQWAADVVLELGLNLIIAKPFPSMGSKWPLHNKASLAIICEKAKLVIDVADDPYSPAKMMDRNKFMVDHSFAVIAVWDGSAKGGTYNCVTYTQAQNKTIYHINPTTRTSAILMP